MDGREDHTILFLPPITESERQWIGDRPGPGGDAKRIFGIGDVRPIEKLAEVLLNLVSSGDTLMLNFWPEENICGETIVSYRASLDLKKLPWSNRPTREDQISSWLAAAAPYCYQEDIGKPINMLRAVKSKWEIDRIRESCRIAGEAHIAAMKATKHGVKGYELEALAMKIAIENGAFYYSYAPIIASGKNSVVLHYDKSSGIAKRKDLILMDFGVDYRYYSSDITRTWPVSGKFSGKYKKAYKDCLVVHKKLLENVKPGATLLELNTLMGQLLDKRGYKDNYIASVGHHVGMSVHDQGGRDFVFKPGVVVAIEPGIYMFDEDWAVRVEDTVLVTEDGNENLSAHVPIEMKDIENLMKGE
jgi:Xaa-Pro aminopeptidase